MVKNDCPVFVVLYKKIQRPLDSHARNMLETMFVGQKAVGNVSTSELERDMLLKLLYSNSKRLSADYKPERLEYEDTFQSSFILPLGPISMHDLGKLTNNTGCAVCGDVRKALMRCADCQSISYCSRGEAPRVKEFILSECLLSQRVSKRRLEGT
jgi:hypothetical protein